MKPSAKSLRVPVIVLVAAIVLVLAGCDFAGEESESHHDIYPMYVDDNGNGVNDYVERSSHDSGEAQEARPSSSEAMHGGVPMGPASSGHAFVDENGDGICDYAQNGSATWHGPGFVDENENGICDYWDETSPRHQRHNGMQFQDHNENRINDFFEEGTHRGPTHSFVDENGDGICDHAQDGSPTWHGPNFVDEDGDGRLDHWDPGGRGHGGGHHGGRGRM
jgi:hypothetical protein